MEGSPAHRFQLKHLSGKILERDNAHRTPARSAKNRVD